MRERILKFLDIEKISPSKFADEIGIQRSSISHILSGRNNPSLEVIQKILTRFPYLNAEWLITGKGEMFKPERHPTIFDSLIGTNKEQSENKNESTQQTDNNKIENTEQQINQTVLTAGITEMPLNTNLKKVQQIIVLYDDGTASLYKVL